MEITARRYTSPATPPRLVVRAEGVTSSVDRPVLCLRCGGATGHTPSKLVSFEWGRVTPSYLRR